jgi:hypothetical protein
MIDRPLAVLLTMHPDSHIDHVLMQAAAVKEAQARGEPIDWDKVLPPVDDLSRQALETQVRQAPGDADQPNAITAPHCCYWHSNGNPCPGQQQMLSGLIAQQRSAQPIVPVVHQ